MPALRPRTAVLVVLVVTGLTAGWLALTGARAQSALRQAQDSLAAARVALADRQLDAAGTAVRRAGERTEAARAATSDPVWRLAGAVPGLGRTVSVVRGLAAGADDLARQVLPAALTVAEQVDTDRLRSAEGVVDVGLLHGAQPGARASAEAASAVLRRLADLPDDGVAPLVGARRAQLLEQAGQLASVLSGVDQALRVAPALLGEDRPRRYLVVVQQTSESRGTGGILGGFVLLEADAGRLRVLDQGSNAGMQGSSPVAPPAGVSADFVALYEQRRVFEFWQNANVSPDLTVGARIYAARWAARGGGPLDGVAVLDSVALADLLRGSPPLDIGEQSVPVEGLVQYLGLDQYRSAEGTVENPGTGALERKEDLQEVVTAASSRLVAGGGETVTLLRGLVDAVRSGHVRMASDDPVLGPLLAQAGVDGALPRQGPVAYPVVNNLTEGKLDYFLRRSAQYQVGACEGPLRRTTVTVRLVNDVPAGDLPPYVTIRRPAIGLPVVSSTTNAVSLSVYATRGARLLRATLDGVEPAPVGPRGEIVIGQVESGVPFWNVELDLPPGEPRTLVLQLEEPVVPGQPRVLEQPLATPLASSVRGPTCG